MTELVHVRADASGLNDKDLEAIELAEDLPADDGAARLEDVPVPEVITTEVSMVQMRQELISIRGLLVV